MDGILSQTERSGSVLTRGIYVALALLMIVMAVVGFWESYFGPLIRGPLDMHWVLDVHGAVFTGWLVLFLGQAVLAERGQIRRHQTLGRYVGISLGLLLLAVGLFVAFAVIVPGIGNDHEVPRAFAINLILSMGDLITFALLFGGGILYRRRPAIHKRLLVLATVALMGAPMGRLVGGDGIPFLYIGLRLAPAFVAMGHDLWTRRRVHSAYLLGTGLLLFSASRIFLIGTEVLHTISTWVLHRTRPAVEALLGG